jgi:hypothetical protein
MPIAEPVLGQDLDLTVLEDSFNAPHCESRHIDPANKTCTHTPVAISICRCQNRVFTACAAHVAFIYDAHDKGVTCADCKQPATECWTIHPLEG